MKKHYPQIKAITFDIGNVLVQWDPRLAYGPLFSGRNEELDYFLNEVCTLEWHTRHDKGVPFPENIRFLQEQFPDHAEMIGIYENEWENMFGYIIQGCVALLYQLNELNYPLFALTNFAADKFADFRQKHDFMALFQDVIVSGEEKITKPDSRIYKILLERTGIAAKQTLFIDDRMENLIAAQELGLQTHLFTNADNLKSYLIDQRILPE